MSDEVLQWLEEIRQLKEQLAQLQQERDQLKASEANWRNLYATEAQQRRTDAKLAQQQLAQLRHELSDLTAVVSSPASKTTSKEVTGLTSLETMTEKLGQVIQERDRLAEALKKEREAHEQTRKSLTAVIGETVDQLAKERNQPRPQTD